MQLAASQRAHPPPVPPRPSRQVVAEALKKSPRPPCPTRQAPPPPNQKPWRQEEQKPQQQEGNGNNVNSGRTIIYDSAHLAKASSPPGLESNGKIIDEQKRRPSIDREEKKRPLSRDYSKEQQLQQVNRPVNGKHHKEENEIKIDDTSKRKDEENCVSNNNNNNNNNNINDNEKNQCNSSELSIKPEIKAEGSAERKKKKGHNVSFKEEPVIVEPNNRSPTITTDKCATVVVIDDASENVHISSSNEEEHDNIQRQDWLEAGVRYSSTKITLPAEEVNVVVNGFDQQQQQEQEQQQQQQQQQQNQDNGEEGEIENQLEFGDLDFSSIIERIAMSSLQGLPPLPRSLSGFNLNGAGLVVEPPPPPPARSTSKSQRAPKTPTSTTSLSSQGSRPSPQGRQLTTLDTQLAILRREMFGLRQLDLSLLSQLWSLNESIQEFRQLLQEQEDRAPSPSPSSEEGDDTSYGTSQPPPPPRRPAPTTPHHHHHHSHHHHHRSSRSVRSSKLPPSDESPSSEEYGAV